MGNPRQKPNPDACPVCCCLLRQFRAARTKGQYKKGL